MGTGEDLCAGAGARKEPAADEIRGYLDTLTASQAFALSSRRAQLLRYLVTRTLAGEGDKISEYAIAVDVFEKPETFDPRTESIVRSEISRLRQKLKSYYAAEGATDPLRIDLPGRSYVPAFAFAESPAAAPARAETTAAAAGGPRSRIWPAIVFGAAILAVIAGLIWRRTAKEPDIVSTMAVLPFVNLTGDGALEYISDSLTDEITESLAEVRDLRVVARTSAFQFKGKSKDVREIGRALNAGALLEGSVTREQGNYRIIAQLIRAADGYHIWSHTFDVAPASLAAAETGIARGAAQALLPVKSAELRPLAAVKPEAHDLYMRAIYQLQLRTPESAGLSLALAKDAVRIDPTYASAYIAIARAEGTLAQLTFSPARAAFERQEAAARSALEIDPDLSAGHAYLGFIAYVKDWDWPRAEKEFQLALKGSGLRGQAHNLYGWSLITRKRFAEARDHLQVAEELDPLSPGSRSNMVEVFIFERKFAEARAEIEGIFKLNPKSLVGLGLLRWTDLLDRDCAGAREAQRKTTEFYPQLEPGAQAAIVAAGCGDAAEARRQMAVFERKTPKAAYSAYQAAEVYAQLRDTGHAIQYLEQSAEERQSEALYLEIDSLLDPVRSDPSFIRLESRLGLKR